jgi:tetratricopeptide (TPR) repeat protein
MKSFGRYLVAASAAAALTFGAGAALADVKAGVDAWQAGNFPAAVKEWRSLADRGDADAQFNLGQAYKLGRGVPQNMATAQGWYQKAAQQGHEQAQANLGLILYNGGNRSGAMPWIRKAADFGDPRAQYVLGTELFNGDLVGKDWPRAYALMTQAAAQGLPPAASNLQQMDKFIPLAQRQQGLALARQLEQRAAAAQSQPVRRPAPRVAAVTAAPVPPSRPAAQPAARTAAAPAGQWRIQLGAFGTAANARRHWDSVRAKAGALAGLQPAFVAAGAVTRLQAGPVASRAAADRLCAAAKGAGSACLPVAP